MSINFRKYSRNLEKAVKSAVRNPGQMGQTTVNEIKTAVRHPIQLVGMAFDPQANAVQGLTFLSNRGVIGNQVVDAAKGASPFTTLYTSDSSAKRTQFKIHGSIGTAVASAINPWLGAAVGAGVKGIDAWDKRKQKKKRDAEFKRIIGNLLRNTAERGKEAGFSYGFSLGQSVAKAPKRKRKEEDDVPPWSWMKQYDKKKALAKQSAQEAASGINNIFPGYTYYKKPDDEDKSFIFTQAPFEPTKEKQSIFSGGYVYNASQKDAPTGFSGQDIGGE